MIKKGYADSSTFQTRRTEYEKATLDFIMSAERIDKNSESFRWVVDDVKRMQTTAVLSRTLSHESVVLCIGRKEMPKALKVFCALDTKDNRNFKVFIDVTGLITIKEGMYKCSKVDQFCTYLMSAMMMLVYNTEPDKILRNSQLMISSLSCYVSLFTHILDYLRLNGFAENKEKISYIIGMFFQCGVLGFDRDNSTKNMAAKIANVKQSQLQAYEFYYEDSDLVSLKTLIQCLVANFNLKGLTDDLFLEKWIWQYGTGTQFAPDVFVAFSKMITDAYAGSYINNHKTIEKCCGRDMVTYTTTLLRVCGEVIDTGMRYEESRIDIMNRSDHAEAILESLISSKELRQARKLDDVLNNPSALSKRLEYIVSLCKNQKEIDKELQSAVNIINAWDERWAQKSVKDSMPKYNCCTITGAKIMKKYCSSKLCEKYRNMYQKGLIAMTKMVNSGDNTYYDINVIKKTMIPNNKKMIEILS